MRKLHLAVGILAVVTFLISGQLMRHHSPPMTALSDSVHPRLLLNETKTHEVCFICVDLRSSAVNSAFQDPMTAASAFACGPVVLDHGNAPCQHPTIYERIDACL